MTPDPFLAGTDLPASTPVVQNSLPVHTVQSSDVVRMGEIFEVGPRIAGESVTEASAMRISAVWACVRLLAGSVGILPLPTYQYLPSGDREKTPHDTLWKKLNVRPNPRWTSTAFWEWITASMLLRGDGFARVERAQVGAADGRGTVSSSAVVNLWPLHPDSVRPEATRDGLIYHLDNLPKDMPQDDYVNAADMLHFTGFGFDGVRSLSAIKHGANTAIGVAQAADRQAGVWLKSGGAQQHVIHGDKKLSEEQIEQFRKAYGERYADAASARLPLVLTEGFDVKTISVSAEEAQLLESRRFQVEDIARAYGVPPFMIGSMEKNTAWGTGLEQMGRGYLIYALQPHLNRFEQEVNEKLMPGDRFVEFNVDGLHRADLQTRHEGYQKALGGNNGPGWMTVNEIRRKENLPRIDGHDDLFKGPVQPSASQSEENDEV